MVAITFALASSVIWGVCDFVAGILSRRRPVIATTFLVQISALGAAAIVTIAQSDAEPRSKGVLVGFAAGLCGAVSVSAFYRAMSLGLISVASPLLASGSVVAFALAVAAGERPSVVATIGAGLAFSGAVLTATHKHAGRDYRRNPLTFALLSAGAFGCALYLLGLASRETGTVFAVLSQRTASFLVLALLWSTLRPSLRFSLPWLGAALGIGLGTTVALLFFGLAANRGLISIVSILASLYPVVTILLASIFLDERLRGRQLAGVPLTLLGIAVVAAGR